MKINPKKVEIIENEDVECSILLPTVTVVYKSKKVAILGYRTPEHRQLGADAIRSFLDLFL